MEISTIKKNIEKYKEMEYNSIHDVHDYIDKNEKCEMYLIDRHGDEKSFDDGLFGLLGILGVDSLDDLVNIKYIKNEFIFELKDNGYILGSL